MQLSGTLIGTKKFLKTGGADLYICVAYSELELPLFTFEQGNATENFHEANKLGQGGFGPVYKGKLANGKEVAVERLSRSSGQGAEEFMNEVVAISKSQHRNLVTLLGCSIEGEEKMLIYEYRLKRSLDALLFGQVQREKVSGIEEMNGDGFGKIVSRKRRAPSSEVNAASPFRPFT
ncbi:hypothetical protein LguiA_025285 [Lonicera macranthoides]